MEQLVARRAHNPKVVGSSPAPATISSGCNGFELHPLIFYDDIDDILKKVIRYGIMCKTNLEVVLCLITLVVK